MIMFDYGGGGLGLANDFRNFPAVVSENVHNFQKISSDNFL